MFAGIAKFTLVGYLIGTRSFAYLGIQGANIFVGEVVLATFLLFNSRALMTQWLKGLLQATFLTPFSWALSVFLLYGAFELLHGMWLGYSLLTGVRSFAFHYYPLYFFIGVWLAYRQPDVLAKLLPVIAWTNGIYGVLYLVELGSSTILMNNDPPVKLFGQPGGAVIVLLGLSALDRSWRTSWHLYILNGIVLLGIQVRAQWLALLVGLIVFAILKNKRSGRIMIVASALLAVLVVGQLSGVPLDLPRSENISFNEVLARGLAPFLPTLAGQLSEHAIQYAGTFEWRVIWWQEIWDSVHQTTQTSLWGHGYGFPLWEVVPFIFREVRTPHNVFLYALGYGGWMGVIVFYGFQYTLMRTLWKSYKLTAQPLGLMLFAGLFSAAHFANVLEAPFGAIPFYLLTGMCAGPLLRQSAINRQMRVTVPGTRSEQTRHVD